MSSQLDRDADALFPQENRMVSNVKFFRGLSREVTAEQLNGQLQHASLQVAEGRATLVMDIDNHQAA